MDTQYVTLVANTVATITLEADYGAVEIVNLGTDPVYARTDGTAPGIAQAGSAVVLPNGTLELKVDTDGDTVVKLKSVGTPTVGVTGGSAPKRAGAGMATTSVAGNVEIANDAGNPIPVSGADGADVTQGAKGDAAWDGVALSASVVAALKAIYSKLAAKLGLSVGAGAADATTLRVVNASDGPTVAALGTTADAAVGDANGSINAHVRQVAKLLAASLTVSVGTEKAYSAPVSGELAGNAAATQMPNIACSMVMFKAEYDNVGRVYIGVAGVTKADGATDTTTGWQLSAGEATPWIPVDNLNRLFRICDNAGDDLTYMALA